MRISAFVERPAASLKQGRQRVEATQQVSVASEKSEYGSLLVERHFTQDASGGRHDSCQ